MKISDILDIETHNNSSIYLIKEGLFLRAYERSALAFVENIDDFHVIKRFYKNINSVMVYVGFPAKNLSEILKRKNLPLPSETSQFFVLDNFSINRDFDQWKSSIKDNSAEEQISSLLLQEQIMPNLKDKHPLQIFKSGLDLLVEIYRFSHNFTREYKFTIGEELKKDAFALALYTYRYAQNDSYFPKKDNDSFVVLSIEQIDVIRLRLRLLVELKQISINSFSQINTRIEYLKDQLIRIIKS